MNTLTLLASTNADLEILVNEPIATLSQTDIHLEMGIDKHPRAEDTLRKAELLARSTLDALSAHLAILDETGTIIAVNLAWRLFAEANAPSLTGLAEGANYLAVCETAHGPDSEGAAAFAAGIRAVLSGARDEFVLEYPCHAPDEKRWFIGRVTRFTADGVPRLVVAHEDMTERRRAEAVLLESEERYRRVSEMIVDFAYSCFKPAGGAFAIDWLVGAVERISGYTAEEVRSHGCWKFCVHPSDVRLFEKQIIGLNPGNAGDCELRIVHKDGTIRWIRALSKVIEEGGDPLSHRLFGTCEDITERRHSEQKLKESEERFKVLFEDSRDALMTLEPPSWTFSEANAATLEMFGAKNKEEFLSCNPWKLSPERQPDGRLSTEKAMEMFQTAMREGCHFFEWTHKRTDGEEFPATVRLSKMEYAGKLVLQATVRNITERKRAEEALRESETRFRAFMRHFPGCAYIKDAERRMVYLNEAFHASFGIQPEDWLGKTAEEIWPAEVAAMIRRYDDAVLQGDTVEEISDRPARGEIRTWLSQRFPIQTKEGPPLIGAISLDITDRKRTMEALREANEYLNNLINHANAPIIVWDPEYRITRFNQAFEKLTGRRSHEVIGESLEILFPPMQVDASMSYIRKTQPHEHWETVEIGILHTDGTVRSVLWNSATIFATDGVTPVATIAQGHDITERKQAEEEKAHLQVQAWQLQKAESLGRMAGAIAHHFNNQLQAVMGNLELAMDDLPQGTRPHAHITDAMRAAGGASEISGRMLAYLGQASGDREPLDLSEVCRQGLPMLRSAMPKGTVLETALPCPGPAVRANANQLQQVLTNLVTNAWEACGERLGAVHLAVKTVPWAEIRSPNRFPIDWQPQDTLYACLEVADTGCGVEDKDIEKFFDPFFSSKFAGRGLGLAVVLGIVRAHLGAVVVESDPGRGSVFRVYLPVCAGEVPHQPDKTAPALEMEEGGTVLLVEDEEIVRDMAEAVLTNLGFRVLAAEDGFEAVEVLRQHRDEIRCVLLDLTMPHMDGWETLAALRELRSDLPVVLVSGYDEAKVMQGAHAELPQAFLHKPYKIKDLKAALNAAQKTPSSRYIGS